MIDIDNAQRICAKCAVSRPASDFMRHKAACRQCRTESQRAWVAANREHVNAGVRRSRQKDRNSRRWDLAKLYGQSMTPERFDSMLASQGYLCAICRKDATPDSMGRTWAIDHCHESGEIRGLLCRSCNIGLGMFRDNPDLLGGAIAYLSTRGGAYA